LTEVCRKDVRVSFGSPILGPNAAISERLSKVNIRRDLPLVHRCSS
jgi:hypothetical protein